MYARAREERGDVLAREILEIADAPCADQEYVIGRLMAQWLSERLGQQSPGRW
jgi:hypothetical protein